MAYTEIITRVIHDRTIFNEYDYVRIHMKPSDRKHPERASAYIGRIKSIQNGIIVFECNGMYFNIDVYDIDKMRFAHEKETFDNTPNFEDTYKEE